MCQESAMLVTCLAGNSCCLIAIVLLLGELGCEGSWGVGLDLRCQFKASLAGRGGRAFSAWWYGFCGQDARVPHGERGWRLPGKPQAVHYPCTVLRCLWAQHQSLYVYAYATSGFRYHWLSCSRDQFFDTENTTFSGIAVRIWFKTFLIIFARLFIPSVDFLGGGGREGMQILVHQSLEICVWVSINYSVISILKFDHSSRTKPSAP